MQHLCEYVQNKLLVATFTKNQPLYMIVLINQFHHNNKQLKNKQVYENTENYT